MTRPLTNPWICIAIGVLLIVATIGLNLFGLLAFLPHTPVGVGTVLVIIGVFSIITRKPVPLNEALKKPVSPTAPSPERNSESNSSDAQGQGIGHSSALIRRSNATRRRVVTEARPD
jgi:hypothetical protein